MNVFEEMANIEEMLLKESTDPKELVSKLLDSFSSKKSSDFKDYIIKVSSEEHGGVYKKNTVYIKLFGVKKEYDKDAPSKKQIKLLATITASNMNTSEVISAIKSSRLSRFYYNRKYTK